MMDIRLTPMAPIVVKHPFTDSGIAAIRNGETGWTTVDLLADQEGLRKWRESWMAQIDAEVEPSRIFSMITKPYQFAFLKFAAPVLSEQDLALFLTRAWTMTEAPNSDPNLGKRGLLSMFRSIDPQKLMSEEEYAQFQALEDTVTVYRGVTSYNAQSINALSWSLDREVAEWFAHRYGGEGTVYEAQVKREHIYAIFNGRNEAEVIVDPKHLIGLTQIQEQQSIPEMGMGMELM